MLYCDDFFREFKRKVVTAAFSKLPEDYRHSTEYSNLSLDEKYDVCWERGVVKEVLPLVMDWYDKKIEDLEDALMSYYDRT